MSTKLYMRSMVLRVDLTLLFVLSTLLAANPLNAGIILVGTASGVDTVEKVNSLIATYNTAFPSAMLAGVNLQVNKLEQGEGSGDLWTNGDWSDNFDFFKVVSSNPTTELGMFGTTVLFTEMDSTSVISQNQNVLGFKYTGAVPFDYYVSKNGNSFSLWAVCSSAPNALHPIYLDTSDTLGLISGSGTYSPANNGVSHVSFYTAVPEPTALALVSFAMVGLSRLRRRSN